MELPSDLVVDGAVKDEVLLCLDLTKMAQLENPIRLVNLVVCLHSKSMWTHSELIQGNTKPWPSCQNHDHDHHVYNQEANIKSHELAYLTLA